MLLGVVLVPAVAGCASDTVDPVVGEWVYDKSDSAISAYTDALEKWVASQPPVDDTDDGGGPVSGAELMRLLGAKEFPKTEAERRRVFGNNIRISKAVIRFEADGRALSMQRPNDPNPQVFRWRRKGKVIEVFIPEMGNKVMITGRLDGVRLWTEGGFPGVREAWVRRSGER
jgi:hypothetical protein